MYTAYFILKDTLLTQLDILNFPDIKIFFWSVVKRNRHGTLHKNLIEMIYSKKTLK